MHAWPRCSCSSWQCRRWRSRNPTHARSSSIRPTFRFRASRVDVYRGDRVVQSTASAGDGTFELLPGPATDVVEATLEGFETIRVPRASAERIVLAIAHATDVTEVVASALTSSGASMERLGSTMAAPLAQKLPAARPRILQSLPLLPSVVRGRDGLLRIGGTRPHESALWIDGFDVTDPVTLTSAIDLPNESVKGMAVVRDPVSATFSGVLGSMASIETTAGDGCIPRRRPGLHPAPAPEQPIRPRPHRGVLSARLRQRPRRRRAPATFRRSN